MSGSSEVKEPGLFVLSYNKAKSLAATIKQRRWSPVAFALNLTEGFMLRASRLVGFEDSTQVDTWVTGKLAALEQLACPLLKSLKVLVAHLNPVKRVSLFLQGLVGRSNKQSAAASCSSAERSDGKEEVVAPAASAADGEGRLQGPPMEEAAAVYEEAEEIRSEKQTLNGSLDMKELGDDLVRRGEELVKNGTDMLQNFLQTIQNSPART
eukprot:768208-Hanusia_phi.AAC.4